MDDRPAHARDKLKRVLALELVLAFAIVSALALRFVFERAPGTSAAQLGMPLDDAWIHLVYARAFADGDGLAYNPAQLETGSTSPLWAILLAGCFVLKSWCGLSIVTLVKALGTLLGTAEVALGAALARRLTGLRLAGWIAGLLIALDPLLAFARVSGMEVPLTTVLILAGVLALHARREWLALCAFALAPTARPEALLVSALFVPLVIAHIVSRTNGQRLSVRVLSLLPVPMSALPFAAWMLFCLRVSGHPLPATFYRKHGHVHLLTALEDLVPTTQALLSDVPMFALGLGLLAAVLGAARIVASVRDRFEQALRVAIAAWPLVWFLGCVWAHNLIQPLAFYWYRYLAPALPGFAVLIACGCAYSLDVLRKLFAARGATRDVISPRTRGLAVLISLALAYTALITPTTLARRAVLYAWNCQNIEEMQVAIGKWIDRNLPPDAIVATQDAGAVRYFGRRTTLDMAGLNAHRVLERGLPQEISRIKPSAFVIFPFAVARLPASPALHEVFAAESPHYTICEGAQSKLLVFANAPSTLSAR